jgi:hypothetical protein
MMDVGKAFTFMFQDPNWVSKIGIGVLVLLAGIVLTPVLIGLAAVFILMGYSLDVVRNVLDGKQHPLPEWQDWGGFFVRGLKLFGAQIVWALPFILVAIPVGIGSALTSGQNQSAGVIAIGALFLAGGIGLTILYGIFMALLYPAIYLRLARTDRFAAALEVGKLWGFTRDNIGNVIIAILLTWLAGLVGSIIAGLGFFALIIGLVISIPFAALWQMLVQVHLYGQIGAASKTPI